MPGLVTQSLILQLTLKSKAEGNWKKEHQSQPLGRWEGSGEATTVAGNSQQMELGGCKPRGFQRGAGRVRRGLASPRWQSHFIRRTQHPSHPANAAGELNRSPSGAWAADRTGMCVHRDVRGSYVGTDAAPGQSGPFATFSPEDVCHRDLEAACTSQETSFGHSGSLSLWFYFIYLLVYLSLRNDLVCPEPAFSQRKCFVRKWKEKSARNVPTVVPDITSMNWGPRDQPKIWGQASVGGEDSRSGLLSSSPGHTGIKLREAGNPACLIWLMVLAALALTLCLAHSVCSISDSGPH